MCCDLNLSTAIEHNKAKKRNNSINNSIAFHFPYITECNKNILGLLKSLFHIVHFIKKGDDIKEHNLHTLGHLIIVVYKFLPDIHRPLTFPSSYLL